MADHMSGQLDSGALDRIRKHDRQGQLASLSPVSPSTVAEIAERFPAISTDYLAFIQYIGVGTTTADMQIYLPQPASLMANHPSSALYATAPAQALFGTRPAPAPIPDDAVLIADSGASWRYCLCPSVSGAVFVLDVAGPSFDQEAPDFTSFVCDTLILEGEQP